MKLRVRSLALVATMAVTVLGLPLKSFGFDVCRGLFAPAAMFSYDVVTNTKSLSTVVADGVGGSRTVFTVGVEPGHRVEDVHRLSRDEVIVEYVSDPVYYTKHPTVGTFSLQILKINADGSFTGLQKFDGTPQENTSLRHVVDANTFIAEKVYEDPNRGNDALLYRRAANGRFEISGRINRVEFSSLDASRTDPRISFIMVESGHFSKEAALYRFVPGSKKPELILAGGRSERQPGQSWSLEPNRIYRLAGDIFGRGLTTSMSWHLREIEVFEPQQNGKMKSVGTIESTKRDLRNYIRTVEEVDAKTFAVLDDHSYSVGLIHTQFQREMDLTIVRVADGKMSRQLLQLNDQFAVGTPDAVGLKLEVLDSKQLLLVGRGYMQVVRAPASRFAFAEVVRIPEFAEAPLKGSRIEIVRISDTRFIVQDMYVLERGADYDLSQIHVFDKVNGVYKHVGSKLLDARRIGNTTVLPDGRIWIDVRPGTDTETPRPRVVDLDQL